MAKNLMQEFIKQSVRNGKCPSCGRNLHEGKPCTPVMVAKKTSETKI